jgi:hypothetical protein
MKNSGEGRIKLSGLAIRISCIRGGGWKLLYKQLEALET